MQENHLFFALTLTAVLLFCGCSLIKNGRQGAQTSAESMPGLQPIDIPAPKFFWKLQPWKEGKLATIDGRGRFAEISFEKNNKVKIKHLVNFPRRQLDGLFRVWPDADLLWARSGQMQCVANVRNKKTKAFIPFLSWTYGSSYPVLLDGEEGLILFSYGFQHEQSVFRHIYYNYLRDEIISDTGQDQPLDFLWAIDRERVLVNDFSQRYPYRDDKGFIDFYIYNRKTGEKTRNEFTDTVKKFLPRDNNLSEHGAMSWGRRYLISNLEIKVYDGQVKLSWNEDFSKADIYPINEILQRQLGNPRYFPSTFILSSGGEWAAARVGGYRGLYNEGLYKRAFYHMDKRYPGGMSIPILADGYEGRDAPDSAFVNHPEYGWCFVKEHSRDKQQYLQIFKMSDVLAEINRQLPEGEKNNPK